MKKDDNGWSHITHYCKYWVPTNDPIEGCSHAKLLGFALKRVFMDGWMMKDASTMQKSVSHLMFSLHADKLHFSSEGDQVEIELQIFCAFQDVAEERQMFGQNYLKHP